MAIYVKNQAYAQTDYYTSNLAAANIRLATTLGLSVTKTVTDLHGTPYYQIDPNKIFSPGEAFHYTIAITNDTATAMADVELIDAFPNVLRFATERPPYGIIIAVDGEPPRYADPHNISFAPFTNADDLAAGVTPANIQAQKLVIRAIAIHRTTTIIIPAIVRTLATPKFGPAEPGALT